MSRLNELKIWAKENPKIAFVVGMVLFAIFISFISTPARPSVSKQIQELNTAAKQEAKADETEEVIESKLGLKPMVNGDLAISEINPIDTAISGIAYPTVLIIEASFHPKTIKLNRTLDNTEWWINKYMMGDNDRKKCVAENPEKTGLVMIPVAGYSHVNFKIEQPFVQNTNYYYDTEVSILLDGEVIKSFTLTPDSMLTKPIIINANTKDKGMLTIKIKVTHSIEDSYFFIKNPFPVWICDPILTKEGEGDAQ